MINLEDKKCTACGACVNICPKNSITLKGNENGFLYPNVDVSTCVNCGLCQKICPINEQLNSIENQKVYACVNNDKSTLSQATSGGVFGAISTYVLNLNGVVYGCAYTNNLQATHIRVDSLDNLSLLFGSKYLQSNTNNTFKECEEDLKRDKIVLYSGTPCQIDGLKKYLQKDYPNLITVDLVCHGVASQAYFDKFIGYLEEKEGAKCLDYNFRSKKNAGWGISGIATFENKNGKVFDKKQFYFSNYYHFYYLACSTYRDSCYTCKYANLNRVGDFTLGDFWGVEGLNLSINYEEGCSLVLLNSERAKEIFEKLNVQKVEVNIEDCIKYNKQLSLPSVARYDRDKLLQEFKKNNAKQIQKRFKRKNRKQILIGRIKYLIPKQIKKILLKNRYKK